MPRYFFDLNNGDEPLIDEEGMEIDTRQGVQKQIARILVDVARDEVRDGQTSAIYLNVRNQRGQVICTGNIAFDTEWHG